jgi:hypothetical protein
MKTLFITLSLAAFFMQPGLGQDSLYYVHLQNGTTVYGKKVKLVNSLTRSKYLLLDSNRRITLDDVRDFKSWEGTFAVGMIGGYYDAFRLQNEGRRISLYSKCYYESETVWSSAAPDNRRPPLRSLPVKRPGFSARGRMGTSSGLRSLTFGSRWPITTPVGRN